MIDLKDAAVLAAQLRTYLNIGNSLQHVTFSKDDIKNILSIIDGKIAASFRELNYEEKQQINELVTIELIRTGVMSNELPIQPEITPASEYCEEPYHWQCYDGVATEVETLEFLHALVRLLKPKFILETGTYIGYGAVYMALAQQKNGFGHLLSCDTDEDALHKAISLAMANDVERNIQFVMRKGIDVIPQLDDRCLDLVFIDSGDEETRIEEIKLVMSKLNNNGVVVIHDINKLTRLLAYLDFERLKTSIDLLVLSQTPRGLAIFQKV